MFDDPKREIAAARKLIEEVSTRPDIPPHIKFSIIGRVRRRLKALDGDVEMLIELGIEEGFRYEDALDDATDYILEYKPRGDFHAVKTILERTPGSRYCRDEFECDEYDGLSVVVCD